MTISWPTVLRRRPRRYGTAAAVAVLALAATGCGTDPGTGSTGAPTESDTPTATGTTATPVDLSGSWHLVDGADAEGALTVPSGREVTLVVDGPEVSGVAACNRYATTVTVDDRTVSFDGVERTEMGCPPDVMAVEERYVAALTEVTSAARDDGALVLAGPDVDLTYELDPPEADADLVGTPWQLESLVDGDTASSTSAEALLVLSPDGTWRASTGCGDLRGGYRLSGDRVTVHDVRTSPAPDGSCDEQALAQHAHVAGVLTGGFSTTVEGDRLRVRGDDGRGLDYRAR